MTAMVDMDKLQYIERVWNEEILRAIRERRAKPSYSAIVNEIVGLGIAEHKRRREGAE